MAYIDVVFDGPPGHEAGRFVEVENEKGCSVSAGEWRQRPDGYWALRIVTPDVPKNDDSARAIVEGSCVVIRVPIANIGAALEGAWASGCQDGRYRLTNPEVFADALVHELNKEDEIGTTAVHKMLDAGMYGAIDQGAEGVVEHENQEA